MLPKIKQETKNKLNINEEEVQYMVFTEKVSNNAYQYSKDRLNILMKNGDIKDISDASDQFNIDALNKTVNKYFLCYPNLPNK